MGYNNGTYTRNHNFSADASANIKIIASRHDTEWDDLASALTNVVWTRDGNTVPNVDIPMGGRKFIGVGAATSVNNYMRVREFIENVPVFMQDQESSADRISVSAQYFTSVSANQAPGDGTRILVRVASDKSSAPLYLNGYSANVEFQDGSRAVNALVSGGIYEMIFSSADAVWKVTNPDDGRTAAERAAGVTPTNYQYPPGDLRRYGCDLTGATDNSAQIANAILAAVASGGVGYIYHPGGTIRHDSTITVPVKLRIYGAGWSASVFSYTGTSSAWKHANTADSSGYAQVVFENLRIHCTNSANTNAAIELNAGGWSYYELHDLWITGPFRYGMILDAVEICHVYSNIIDNSGASGTSIGVWLVNGDDRLTGQSAGFTNVVSVVDNQISGQTIGIADDGGNLHVIANNNLNENSVPCRIAGVTSLTLEGNSFETQLETGEANVLMTNTTAVSGDTVAANRGGIIHSNTFAGDMLGTNSLLKFAGSAMHHGFSITGNTFGEQLGRGGAIDTTKLSGSFCGFNRDEGTSAMNHYIGLGVHNDADGNVLYPPENDSEVTFAEAAYVYGDTRYPVDFKGGLAIEGQKWQSFTIYIVNTSGTIQHKIVDEYEGAAAPAYADKLSGNSTTLANTPTNLDGSNGFTSGAGLLSGSNHVLVLDVDNDQSTTKHNISASITYYDGNNTNCRVVPRVVSRNINGTTKVRPEFYIRNAMTGAAVNVDTTLLPSGKILAIKVWGWLA